MSWNKLRPILEQCDRFVLTSHVNPDCDALGSELAMAELLESLGKQVRIVNADATPPRLAFVDPDCRIEVLSQEVARRGLGQVDAVMVLDTSAWRQLGTMADVIRAMTGPLVVVDHHASDGELDALMFKDATAEATGRLVFDLARYLEVTLTEKMATSLFAAIATDTGWFRFSSTTSNTHRVVAELVDAGACPQEVYRQLYERDSLSRAKLRGVVLSRIELELGGRLAHTYIRARDFEQTGARRSETEDFVNMALAIDGTQVAILVTEQSGGVFKASFRSRGRVDCSQVASMFDGGGHKAAAGATLHGAFEAVFERVLEAVRLAMK